jgi:AraC-like DNA-binding protein
VLGAARLPASGAADVWDFDEDMDDVARIELVVAVSNLLVGAASGTVRTTGTLALGRLSRVRDLIATAPAERRSMDELERLAGLDRWTLARQFRAAYGTSPSRFRIMRQLDHLRRLLKDGTSLVEVLDRGRVCRSEPHVETIQECLWHHPGRLGFGYRLTQQFRARLFARSSARRACDFQYVVTTIRTAISRPFLADCQGFLQRPDVAFVRIHDALCSLSTIVSV